MKEKQFYESSINCLDAHHCIEIPSMRESSPAIHAHILPCLSLSFMHKQWASDWVWHHLLRLPRCHRLWRNFTINWLMNHPCIRWCGLEWKRMDKCTCLLSCSRKGDPNHFIKLIINWRTILKNWNIITFPPNNTEEEDNNISDSDESNIGPHTPHGCHFEVLWEKWANIIDRIQWMTIWLSERKRQDHRKAVVKYNCKWEVSIFVSREIFEHFFIWYHRLRDLSFYKHVHYSWCLCEEKHDAIKFRLHHQDMVRLHDSRSSLWIMAIRTKIARLWDGAANLSRNRQMANTNASHGKVWHSDESRWRRLSAGEWGRSSFSSVRQLWPFEHLYTQRYSSGLMILVKDFHTKNDFPVNLVFLLYSSEITESEGIYMWTHDLLSASWNHCLPLHRLSPESMTPDFSSRRYSVSHIVFSKASIAYQWQASLG
jgi:hypothetical protein